MIDSQNIVDISIQNFQTEVVEKSKDTPVVLEFFADEAEPSRQLAPVLRRLADEYQGKFVLARVDVSVRENQQLVQQLGVRTLPTVKVIFQGQMAQNLEGPIEETQLRELLDQLTMSPLEMIRQHVDAFLAEGNRAAAIDLMRQVIAEEPGNHALQAELADLLVMENRIDEARQILALLPPETEGLSKPNNRIAFIEEATSLPALDALRSAAEAEGADLALWYQIAVRLVADDKMEEALETLLEMLKRDKQFDDELARRTMIRIFELLGKGNETATAYRRKMFTFLH